ncbi:MAG: anaerobic ribonucleoside-triphosphate reductase activating protein [Candidatus Paceibacterota bacterium]
MEFGGFEKFTLIDYPSKVACMVYTIGCPFRCPYCHNPELVDETCTTHIPEKVILDFLDERKGMLDGVVITGGEPSMHGDSLISFMKEAKARGFLVKLDSNGVDPVFLQKVIDDGLVDYIAMDIKSPLAKYTQTVARPVNIEAIKKSIAIIQNSGIEYEFRTTIVKSMLSVEDLEQIGKEIKGSKTYYLQKFIPSKILNPQFLKKVTYSDEEFADIKTMMERYVSFCGIR